MRGFETGLLDLMVKRDEGLSLTVLTMEAHQILRLHIRFNAASVDGQQLD